MANRTLHILHTKIIATDSSHFGGKISDLAKYGEPFYQAGFEILEVTQCIDVSHFFRLMMINHLTKDSTVKAVERLKRPISIRQLNEEIYEKMIPGQPYYIRSSSLGERGGSGIYDSMIYLPTGDRRHDLNILWKVQKRVYASEFSDKAKAYREKHNAKFGMPLLITPVVGKLENSDFSPAYAGEGYISFDGHPKIRITRGIRTEAEIMCLELIDGKVKVSHKEKASSKWVIGYSFLNNPNYISRPFPIFNQITPGADKSEEITQQIIKKGTALLHKIKDIKASLYFEFAIQDDESNPVLIQVNPFIDNISRASINPLPEGYKLVLKGRDIVNYGQKFGKGIVYIDKASPNVTLAQQRINSLYHNYSLIVKPDSLTRALGFPSIGYEHYCNAVALIELQQFMMLDSEPVDHRAFRGSKHFDQLCRREDVFFLGVENFKNDWIKKLPLGEEITDGMWFWPDIEFGISNHRSHGEFFINQHKFSISDNLTGES
ncbi:MAG: hypothetical protein A2Y40_02820 [Candidatus Margulisbacteria bacterium GWF2_35_9]|nr:MAG: hypothetical protein A2Y40_02820 [Candidatus Margulisbacteria bacterium GWF2_35_9]